MYLECQEHDPAILSGEVGQHTYDLPDIQKYLANKDLMIKIIDMDLRFDSGGNPNWANTAAHFFSHHPNCRIGIVDEYNNHYPSDGQ